ncbi:baseplate J/gp47 family protein [uncultured Dokdonia sp.]|uniref:baseplate J/gp47 family protein n=1 Tax=uncultured Dokdonia sp. TaxID=575653 RepID=UPI00262B0FBB|nr:baseplate J/gp47 family protein [uncultured Dokdonia sp.]
MKKQIDTFSHYSDGKSQSQRFLETLDPKSFKLHDLNMADWLLFAYNFAKHVNYFDKDNNTTPEGNWQDFFNYFEIDQESIPRRETIAYKKLEKNVLKTLSDFENERSLTPHLSLFVCFIRLLELSQEKFNNLSKRHLDFYYGEVLKIEKKEAVADKAYIIFELAKKAIQERIPAGTSLDGDKDTQGKKRVYKTNEELVANQAQVVGLRSFLNDEKKKELKLARKADSLDGLEKELPEESNFWWPFGYNSSETNYEELPDANLGFSIASSLLNLKEGKRKVTVTIEYTKESDRALSYNSENNGVTVFTANDFRNNIETQCSGEEEWLSGITLGSVSNTSKSLTLSFELAKDFPAVVNYNPEVLLESFNTTFPVVRFLIKGDKRYDLYQALSLKEIQNITVSVDVEGITTAMIENDNGTLNAEKPYFPFTGQPTKGSNFYIRHPEIFSKNWNNVNVKINWKNTPNSITDHYKAYVFNSGDNLSQQTFKTIAPTARLESSTGVSAQAFSLATAQPSGSVVNSDSYFRANAYLLDRKEWGLKNPNVVLFNQTTDGYNTNFTITNTTSDVGTAEAIRLSLNQTALQDIYPQLYTLALLDSNTVPNENSDTLIPNEPYIPEAQDIELSYSATDIAYSYVSRSSSGGPSENKEIRVFTEDVFGQYIKSPDAQQLVPANVPGGQFYVGLDAMPSQRISLLIQTLEGSENPEVDTFGDREKITWEVLSGNTWRNLSEYILEDDTNNFLKSGIVKFDIPRDVDVNNTRLPKDLVWVRASMKRSYDAVCRVQGVFTQAVLTTFENNDNEVSHLETGLEAETISKLITRIPKIKSVNQNYNSFGGVYEESDVQYYRRISERLRHKNRAITSWDYEQLILENFPEVFKVKCLNHTSEDSFMSPGNVTLVVVPDTRNKNAFDIYQPRVSRNSLSTIKTYINSLNTAHVNASVINPNYQELRVAIAVRFFEQFDEEFYKKQLDIDIKKYISPWAFEADRSIVFDVSLNTNLMLNYIEHLAYVDYIDNIRVYKIIPVIDEDGNRTFREELQTSASIIADPKSILVSAKQHQVTIAKKVCDDPDSFQRTTVDSEVMSPPENPNPPTVGL